MRSTVHVNELFSKDLPNLRKAVSCSLTVIESADLEYNKPMKNSKIRLGYCCINLSLADQKITANRGMIKRTFTARGPAYCGELAHQNVRDYHEWITAL